VGCEITQRAKTVFVIFRVFITRFDLSDGVCRDFGIGTPAAKAIDVRADQTGERGMRWIEIIKLRATKERELRSLVAELGRSLENEFVEFTFYRHATIATDLSVHLVHETEGDSKPDRTLGQRLVATLSDHGLVHHSLWMQVQSCNRRQS
jgi:hypothetical protein